MHVASASQTRVAPIQNRQFYRRYTGEGGRGNIVLQRESEVGLVALSKRMYTIFKISPTQPVTVYSAHSNVQSTNWLFVSKFELTRTYLDKFEPRNHIKAFLKLIHSTC